MRQLAHRLSRVGCRSDLELTDENQFGCCIAATIHPSKLKVFVDCLLKGLLPRLRGRVVLNDLGEQVRDCLKHADCARKAAAQTDTKLKQDFLDLEKRGYCWRAVTN